MPVCDGIDELVFPSFCVEIAAHGIELAEVKSENFQDYESMRYLWVV